MTGFLLDTNVPSELTRPQSDPRVEKWLNDADDERLYLSVVSLGEMLKGLTILPASKRRKELEQWIDNVLRPTDGYCPSPSASRNGGESWLENAR